MDRLSHSQLNGWTGCGYRYHLERNLKVPQVPAWNLIGGSAVHETTEARDLARLGQSHFGKSTDFYENFDRLTAEAEDKHDMDRAEFRASGRSSKAYPEKENETWWLDNGPSMVQRWDVFISQAPWDIWILPDGKPAVEIGFELPVDPDDTGEPRASVRGYIDRVVQDQDGNLIVLDIKTGASKQYSNRQLGTYRVGLQHALGIDAKVGAFWDARSGGATVAPLNDYTFERIQWHYQKLRMSRELGVYLPNPGPLCGSCSVNASCFEYTPEASASIRPPWLTEEEWGE